MESQEIPVVPHMGYWVEKADGELECLYEPQPHQARFHEATTLNCIMEGGAGSGKSMCMRWDAYMRCQQIPRFSALILRRSMPELKMSHLDHVPFEIEKMGMKREAWHSTDFILRFPNGSRLRFGHVEDDATIARYLSSEFDIIYFDELTTFTLRQFLFLSSRARTTKKGLRALVRGGTNPIGPGATWVKRYFIDKDVSEAENPGYNPSEWEAQHSTVYDNKYVDAKDYVKRLQILPSEAMRRAMEHGEWVIEGQFFSEYRDRLKDSETGEFFDWHVIERMPQYKGQDIQFADWCENVVVVDWGYAEEGNPGMAKWYACLGDGSAICFQEYVFKQTLPENVAKEIKRRNGNLRIRYYVGDPQMFTEHEGPSVAELMAREGVSLLEGDNKREPGWVNLHTWYQTLVTLPNGRQVPKLRHLKSGCPVTIRTVPAMTVDPKKPADMITTGVEDEGADTDRYFVMSRPGASAQPQPAPEVKWIYDWILKQKMRKNRLGSEATHRRVE